MNEYMHGYEVKRRYEEGERDFRNANLNSANLLRADLRGADLRGACLVEANLSRAYLSEVNLEGADLREADLWCAGLVGADLGGANLERANLCRAALSAANLRGAILSEADLRLADLQAANLEVANLQGARFDQDTTLPDGTKWTPDTDMARFTDPEHPDFWRPEKLPLLSSYQMVSFRRDYDAGLSQLAGVLGGGVTPPEPMRPPRHVPLPQKVVQEVAATLRRITEEGGDSNFVIFTADTSKNYYIQFAASRGQTTLYCEAVGNENLESAFGLSDSQMAQLLSMGWTSPKQGEHGNFYRRWEAKDDADRLLIAREVIRAFVEVYGWSPDQELGMNLHLE